MTRATASLAALIGVGLITIVIAVRAPDSTTSAAVRAGDQVVGSGAIVSRRGSTMLCRAGSTTDQMEPQAPWCSTIQVPLEGLDVASLPFFESIGDTRFARSARVHGVWTGAAFKVSSVEPATAGGSGGPELSCQPVGPMPSTPADPLELETQIRSLAAEVSRSPDWYAGYWNAPWPPGGEIEVVAVTGEVGAARDRVAAVFRLPFCVIHVPHSMNVLEETAAAKPSSGPSRTLIDIRRNRVRLLVPLLTDADRDWLGSHPAAVAEPLVSKVGS